MSDWTIYITAAGDGPAITDVQLGCLVDELADHGGVATGTPENVDSRRFGATFTVTAKNAPGAAELGAKTFYAAVKRAGMVASAIVHLEVETVDETERAVARPYPTLVGVTEIAELLGVTRQRASTLQTRQGFPPPAAVLKSGPVWMLSDVEGFKSTWARKPGRPRKGVAITRDGKVEHLTADVAAVHEAEGDTEPAQPAAGERTRTPARR